MGNVFFAGGKIGMDVPVAGIPLNELPVGTTIKFNVNGTPTDFIIVNQGIPSDSSLYDSSCDGVWLLMKDLYAKRAWDSSDCDYKNSDIHTYLNGTFLGLLDTEVQSIIKQAKIPYMNGTGESGSVASGSSGLSTKVFLLSGYEVGWTNSNGYGFPVDGACLSYFSGCATTDSKRIAQYEGINNYWWLRSPRIPSYINVLYVNKDGSYNNIASTTAAGIRPAFILPSNTLTTVNDDGSVILKV